MSVPRHTPCAVCGGTPNGSRYGPVTCLGCIVFFRRAIQKGKLQHCEKQCWREVGLDTRSCCRSCRLQKCLSAGMNPNAIQNRDKLGPRQPRRLDEILDNIDTDFDGLLQLQRKQRELHQRYSNSNKKENVSGVVKIKHRLYRRAKPYDIDLVLKLSFRNAIDWAKQFNSFWNLNDVEKKLIMSEFGIAFLLIDQAYKTSCKSEKGFWLLQNDSFLHSDYFLGIPVEDVQNENAVLQSTYHSEFVNDLLGAIKHPFSILKIDKLECVILKILLLLTPSFPGRVKLEDSEKMISKCMSNLMSYSFKKCPDNGMVRFGEVILLIRSIRSAVKVFYNQTKLSVNFDVSKFDSFVKNCFLS